MVEKEELYLSPSRIRNKPENSDTDNSKKKLPLLILDDPPTVVEFWDREDNAYKLVDTLNYWRSSLATLGKGIGLTKLEMPPADAPLDDWLAYCMRDVEIIERGVVGLIQWVKTEDLGMFRLTSPSQAMAAFRHRFMPHQIITHQTQPARRLERGVYFGGQVENFYCGNLTGIIHQLDVTSLYPSVMTHNYYPYTLKAFHPHDPGKPHTLSPGCLNLAAHVRIDTLERTYPYRTKSGVFHVTGNYDTFLCGPELDYAVRHNHVTHCFEWAEYGIADLFSDFVSFFWAKRKQYKAENNPLGDILCKLLMNSLYGKFAQNGKDWEIIAPNPCSCRWGQESAINGITGEVTHYRSLGDVAQIRVACEEPDNSFPGIAAWVTAYGREKMLDLRYIAGQTHCYYQAVDALYVDDIGLTRLREAEKIGQKELGKLELIESFNSAEFRGMNNYTVGSKIVRGSVKPNATKISEHVFEEPKFERLTGILNRLPDSTVIIESRVKHMADTYTRGTIQPSGLVTPPVLTLPD